MKGEGKLPAKGRRDEKGKRGYKGRYDEKGKRDEKGKHGKGLRYRAGAAVDGVLPAAAREIIWRQDPNFVRDEHERVAAFMRDGASQSVGPWRGP